MVFHQQEMGAHIEVCFTVGTGHGTHHESAKWVL
jgi:hypothetical protein